MALKPLGFNGWWFHHSPIHKKRIEMLHQAVIGRLDFQVLSVFDLFLSSIKGHDHTPGWYLQSADSQLLVCFCTGLKPKSKRLSWAACLSSSLNCWATAIVVFSSRTVFITHKNQTFSVTCLVSYNNHMMESFTSTRLHMQEKQPPPCCQVTPTDYILCRFCYSSNC